MKKFYLIIAALMPVMASAQTLNDGLLMKKNDLCTGFMYSHDQWTDYWEGERKRDNENIGKITTQTITWIGVYGITDRINVLAMVPYVKTKPSQGTLTGMEGIQDLSLGVKYNFFRKDFEKSLFKTFGVINFSTPLTNYTADFLPMSIGMESKNISYRLTTWYRHEIGLFVNASAGYTWRSNVKIDRPTYYTGTELYNTNEVKMPNVFDLFVSLGYQKGPLQAELCYAQQNTLGGADIRPQDMPFVSNRMNFSKVSGLVMYYLPKPQGLALRGSVINTVAGRNVGKSTTLMAGILYTIHFSKSDKAE
jgi:hypothetical protein